MVAILVPQPDDTAGDPAPTPLGPSVTPRPGQVPAGPLLARRRAADLADVTRLRPRTVARPLPDRATRVRRRRLVALLLTTALVGVLAVAGRAALGVAGAVEPSAPEAVETPAMSPTVGETYVVQPGDTLWSIAATIAPDSDPRPVVDALRDANGGPNLQVGQRLTITID